MTGIPKKLFDKASDYGLRCIASATGNHRIEPATETETWHLEYLQGRWVLVSRGVPQIHFRYDEVLKFLDRFAPQEPACKA
jgi:hypothetical protein